MFLDELPVELRRRLTPAKLRQLIELFEVDVHGQGD